MQGRWLSLHLKLHPLLLPPPHPTQNSTPNPTPATPGGPTRYLQRIEEGYKEGIYHCRAHAADVLRNMHVLLTRGGVLSTLSSSSAAEQSSGQLLGAHASDCSASGSLHQGRDQASDGYDRASQFSLLVCYLAATVHDFEHRGECLQWAES